MDIHLVRHGIAAPAGPENNFQDERRELTAEGIQKMRQAVKGLRNLELAADFIASSPLIRAVQTAEIVAEALKFRQPVAEWDELAPEAPVEGVFTRLTEVRDRNSVWLVGHQPSIGWLACYLICENSKTSLPFKKGAVLAVRIDDVPPRSAGELLWLLPSKLSRQIGEL
jgi:phosphohistidine phosphatase